MLVKLGKESLIRYEAYKGTRLTREGRRKAVELLRGHRLWEVFLREHLGYSWSEAHEDAELLEHVTPKRLVERLDAYLNHPARCPHGEPIPRAGEQIAEAPLIPLSQVPAGGRIVLRKVREERELMDYLEASGIRLGAKATVEAVGAYEGPVSLAIDGKCVALSHKAAKQIFVEDMEPTEGTD
jgi:DtxR family Mn-dependent transcriptional regulator